MIPVFALKSASTESGRYSPHIKTFTSPLVAAKAFLTNIGATGAKAASAAPRFIRVLRLNSLAAIPVDSEEFLFLVINLPPGLVSRVVPLNLVTNRHKNQLKFLIWI